MENGRLDTLGRWIWGLVCAVLIVLALAQGGLRLLSFVVAAVMAYAILFAIIATLILRISRMMRRDSKDAAPSLWGQFASSFRKALIDGPLFLLAFW